MPVLEPGAHAIKCVLYLANIRRLIRTEFTCSIDIKVLAMVLAYNISMKGVSRFDQQRAANMIARKEQHALLSAFTFVSDACIQIAHVVYKSVYTQREALIPLPEFKRG